MADAVFNIAKGRVVSYYQNVENNSPTGCTIDVVPISSTDTADARQDTDTLSALLALASTSEVTDSTWARDQQVAADITITVDDTNNWATVDLSDTTWTANSGSAATHLVYCYNPTGASADTAIIPLTIHDFAVTPDGSDITAVVNASGIFKAS